MDRHQITAGRLQLILGARKALGSYAARLDARSEEANVLAAFDRLLAETDLEDFVKRLWPRDLGNTPVAFGDKYLDFGPRIVQNLGRAKRLALTRQQGKAILDLGAGTGLFCWVANYLGHCAIALQPDVAKDVSSLNIETMATFLGVQRCRQSIISLTPIERTQVIGEQRFDLVTAFAIQFDSVSRHKQGLPPRYWTSAEYLFLLNDLRSNFLRPDGVVVLKFNRGSSPELPLSLVSYHQAVDRMLAPFVIATDDVIGLTLDLRSIAAWRKARAVPVTPPSDEELAAWVGFSQDAHQERWTDRHRALAESAL